MKRNLASLLLFTPLALAVFGCGGSDGSSSFFAAGNGGGQQQPNGSSTPAPSFQGRVVLRPIAVIKEAERAEIVQFKSTFEVEGVRISPDGRFVVWPESPASAWIATLGSQTVVLDVDGTFAFQPPTDGASEGVLRHPSDPTISYRFTLAQLTQAGGLSLTVPRLFAGPCGMDVGETRDFCGPTPPVTPRAQIAARVEGLDPATLRPSPRTFHQQRQIKAGPLGTYPNFPSAQIERRQCPDKDGIFQAAIIPVVGDPAKYLLSTCHDFVLTNACLNENDLSDAEALLRPDELETLIASLRGQETIQTEFILLPRIPVVGNFDLHCYQNHKRRSCSQINIGDVACKLPNETIVKPTGTSLAIASLLQFIGLDVPGFATVEVEAGTPQTITLHNNGSFGITKITKIKDDLKGELSGASIAVRDTLQEIRHYEPINYVPPLDGGDKEPTEYVADREIKYTAPGNAQPGQLDSFRFLVDDRYVVITFKAVAARPFLRRLGSTDELTVQDLNAAGTFTSHREGKTYLEPLGQDRIELLAEPGLALLNDEGHCFYQADNHQSHARFRTDELEVEIKPPLGSLSTFSEGIVSLSPDGLPFAKAKRADGKNDFFTTTDEGARFFLQAPEGLAPSTEVTVLNATTKDALYGNSPGGNAPDPGTFAGFSNAGKLVRWDFATRTWASNVTMPRADFLPAYGDRYVDATSNGVLRFVFGNNFAPAAPPAGVTWFSFFSNILISGQRDFRIEQESRIESSGGSQRVTNTTEPVPSSGTFTRHSVAGVNDAGEVIGTYRDNTGSKSVLFSPTGQPQSIDSLLPAGAPAGTWTPVRIAGRYVVLTHTDGAGANSVYMWFRGSAPN